MAEELYFSADAALIDRLGRELVGKQETALIELVKNSYDADATTVTITLQGDHLTIRDNGNGMSRQELIDGYLRLASDLKIRKPTSDRFQRRLAGRKGIGRFAAQRLGTYLVLRTWKLGEGSGIELKVNWRAFERGRALEGIPVLVDEISREQSGTEIDISGLRDTWSDSQFRRCWRGVFNLLQPFPVAPVANRPDQDPGFKVSFYRADLAFVDSQVIVDLDTELLNHLHAVIELRVDLRGHAEWRIRQNKFGANIDWTRIHHADREALRPPAYSHLRRVWMKAYYAILDPSEFSPLTYSRVRDLLNTEGGIRLYRNGFRVVPYGDPNDDWLSLDEAYARRSFLFPIANRNWFGVIEVQDPEGDLFDEPTSREGLIETPAFQELRELVSSVLITGAQRIAEQRDRKIRAGTAKTPLTDESFLRRLTDASRKAAEAESGRAEAGDREGTASAAETAKLLSEAKEFVEGVKAQYADEASMLRLLATLGLTAAEFSHETGMTFQAVRLDFQRLFEIAREGSPSDSDVTSLIERARNMVDRLDALTSYINEIASARSTRELGPVSVSRSLEEFERGMRDLAKRAETELIVESPAIDGLYSKPMHRAEVASILLNFYSNSLKAMKRVAGPRRILVQADRDDQEIVLRFSDTGDGIPKENRDRVFDLFFTTRPAAATKASTLEESTGTGFGLWIVRQIVTRAQGAVEVVDPTPSYATTLEVRLPADGFDEP